MLFAVSISTALLVTQGKVALADDLPPLSYFNGTYKAIGILSDKLVSGQMTISNDGKKLTVRSTELGGGWLAANTSSREGASPLAGELNGRQMLCLYQNDSDNYPRLTCKVEPASNNGLAGLLTLWPQQ